MQEERRIAERSAGVLTATRPAGDPRASTPRSIWRCRSTGLAEPVGVPGPPHLVRVHCPMGPMLRRLRRRQEEPSDKPKDVRTRLRRRFACTELPLRSIGCRTDLLGRSLRCEGAFVFAVADACFVAPRASDLQRPVPFRQCHTSARSLPMTLELGKSRIAPRPMKVLPDRGRGTPCEPVDSTPTKHHRQQERLLFRSVRTTDRALPLPACLLLWTSRPLRSPRMAPVPFRPGEPWGCACRATRRHQRFLACPSR
jgi:hypothetical protein